MMMNENIKKKQKLYFYTIKKCIKKCIKKYIKNKNTFYSKILVKFKQKKIRRRVQGMEKIRAKIQ